MTGDQIREAAKVLNWLGGPRGYIVADSGNNSGYLFYLF